jgi:bacteriocin biosynthesis cyclodehydratase domain-containing protein
MPGSRRRAAATDLVQEPTHVLHPAARLLWRGHNCVQLELGTRAVIVDGLSSPAAASLTGHPSAANPAAPVTDPKALEALMEAGFVWARQTGEQGSKSHLNTESGPDTDSRLAPPRPRLAADLGSLSSRFGERGAEVLHARRHCAVTVQGSGRVAGHVAAVLAAAGVGRVHLTDEASARLHQAQPGGVLPSDEGRSFALAATEAVLRAAPEADTSPLPIGERPDLVVLAIDGPVDPGRHTSLHTHDRAHLPVQLGADHGTVGPLVIPGLTACLRCVELHRRDRDPAWPTLSLQLGMQGRRAQPSDVAVATVVAGVAALQALAYLDGDRPDSIDGTIELHLPDWRLRRRSWPLHPDCGCDAVGAAVRDTPPP